MFSESIRTDRLRIAMPMLTPSLCLQPQSCTKAPQSKEKPETQATHIVRGKVLDVTTKVEKSQVETDPCNHKDTIYTITVQVERVSKGDEAKEGGKITVLAWQPHTRETQLPGSLGYDVVRRKGETATFCLTGKGKEPFEPITPNGVAVDQAKK